MGTLANTAAVSVPPGTTDPDGANNTVIDSGPRTPMADLTIAKSHAPAIVVPGQPVTYTIDVWNNGPSDAPNAVVNDDLISALRNVAWTCVGLGGGSCDGASGAGDIATTVDLPTNSGARFTIRADVAAGFTGSLTNVASIDPPVGVRDPDPASNTASDPGATLPETDLRVTKSHLGSIVPGEDVTYSIVVSNSGPSDASNATVTDVLPAGLDSATATWTCTATAPNSCTSPSGTGDIVGQTADIVVNGSVTFTVIARVDPTYRGTMTNAASVVAAAGTVDLDLANNDGVDTAAVVARADLTVTKAHLGDLVPGRPVTWTIRVRNNGPSVVSAAEINDVLPGAVSGVAWTCSVSPASTPGALAEFGSFTNSCAIGSGVGTVNNSLSLGVGAVATITVNAIIDPGARGAVTNGELINTAEVFLPSGVIDPTAGNNIGLDRGPLLPSVDLAIVKSHVGPLVPGALVRYQIIVTNAGPSTAVAAPVTDTLPSGLGGATWTCVAAGGSCAAATGVNDIETTLTLPPGASATFTVLATIAADARGLLTNIASVTPDPTGGEIDLTTTDQTATDIGALTPRSDLSIEKFHTGELVPGQRSRWTIVVTNAGPSSAVDATVLDTLPPSLSAATWTCSTRKLLGSIGETACGASDGTDSIATTVSLAAGSAATYVLDALIDPSTLGAIVNSASVAPPIGTSDPEGTRNSATDSGTGVPTADLAVVKTHAGAIVPGEPVMYTIVITNNGPSRVTGAAVRDDLPSSLRNGSWSCVASARSSCDSASGVGSIASTVSLDPFGTATYTLVADVSPDAIGPVVNAASATPPAGVRDPQSSNNTGVDGGASVPTADLRITKVHVGEVAAGKPVTYVIVVENAGPSDVVGAGISDIVAPYLLTPSWTCISTVASTCPASGEGSPTLIADIASGGKLTITLTAMVGAEAPSEAVNTARVNVPVGVVDRFPASNEATDRALVFRLAPILVVPILVVPPTTIVGEVTSTGATPPSVDTTLSAPPAQASGASIPSGPFVRPTTAASVSASISSPTGSKTVPTGIDQGQTKSNGVAGVNASRDTLSLTGSNAVDLVLLGFALLAGGVALVGVSRRRRVRR